MRLLSVFAHFHQRHNQVLGRHERELLCNVSLYDFGVYNESFGDVAQRREHNVSREKCLREYHTSVCAIKYLDWRWHDGVRSPVVQSALEPLYTRRSECILMPCHQQSR